MKRKLAFIVVLLFVADLLANSYFVPPVRVRGVGVERKSLNTLMLSDRTTRMILSQTFGIMKNKEAVDGAKRVHDKNLVPIFTNSARVHGFSSSKLQAIAYLESWGIVDAKSPTGPRGIMQFTQAAARDVGLYKTKQVRERILVSKKVRRRVKGRIRTVTIKVPRIVTKTVVLLDERGKPERAIPAAAKLLAQHAKTFGREDFAIAAYHGGARTVTEWLSAAIGRKVKESEAAEVVRKHGLTVPKLFFGCSPVHKVALWRAISKSLRDDYSPTYWFRVMRAEQLLSLYRADDDKLEDLAKEYENKADSGRISPSRFWSWLTKKDLVYDDRDDLREAIKDGELVPFPRNPAVFGFSLRTKGKGVIGEMDLSNQRLYLHATPDVRGAIMYIAYELRRMAGKEFVPLDITSLVRTHEYQKWLKRANPNADTVFPSHVSGKVFDISYQKLKPRQREFLEFILQDLEWAGLLGFVKESARSQTFHIAPAPAARNFFSQVYPEPGE